MKPVIPLLAAIYCAISLMPLRAATPQAASESERKLERGGKVVVRNPSGHITIIGWDRDVIQATATSEGRAESLPLRITEDSSRARTLLITPAVEGRSHIGRARLDIKLPRYAEIESVSTNHGGVEVTSIDGSVRISTHSGAVVVNRLGGSAAIQSTSGNITAKDIKGDVIAKVTSGSVQIDDVGGLVNVTTTSRGITVHNAASDVRAVSISGSISIQCAKGRVEASSVSGSITLTGIGGDVDATATSGGSSFTGSIRAGGRYRLKAMSGAARMAIQADPLGFTATLSSFSGAIETEFPLTVEGPLQSGPINRRIIGRYGDGQAQITLDSFSGTVKLSKAAPAAAKDCR